MVRTYKAILHGNHVEWIDEPPNRSGPVPVHITLLEGPEPESLPNRGRAMAEALARLAAKGTFSAITDPVAWQRAERHERGLPGR